MTSNQFKIFYPYHVLWMMNEESGVQLHLKDENIRKSDMSALFLCGAIFEYCVFEDCKFDNAFLNGACFRHCDFVNCSFKETTANGCDFLDAHFEDCVIKDSLFNYSNFYHAGFGCCEISKSQFQHTCLDDCDIADLYRGKVSTTDCCFDFSQYAQKIGNECITFLVYVETPTHMFLKDGYGYDG